MLGHCLRHFPNINPTFVLNASAQNICIIFIVWALDRRCISVIQIFCVCWVYMFRVKMAHFESLHHYYLSKANSISNVDSNGFIASLFQIMSRISLVCIGII